MPTLNSVCALCESRCGVLVEVEGDRVLRIAPDPDHPVSRGHGCVKGLQFQAVHHHPDRLLHPSVGGQRLEWAEALEAVGGRLRAVVDQHGPDAVGIYSGNAAGHSLGAVLGVAALQRGLGTTRHYSCLTLDNAPQFVVYEEVFGAAMRTFAADFANADAICLIGTDPLSSQCSQAQSNPRGPHHLRAAGKAGRLWVVDPRSSKTAQVGHHLAPRPGSDVALLGWLLREALGADRAMGEVRAGDLQALTEGVRPFDRDRAVRETGLSAEALQELCDALIRAERPLVWSGLGVLLGGEGTLGFWLTVCLQAALGGLGGAGGWQVPSGFDLAPWARRLGLRARDPRVRGRSGHAAILDTLPAADLPADVEAGALRALVVVGGNPALSLPDHGRARRALEHLDLLVCVDLFRNDTGVLADALLPAASWLARDDLPLHLAGQRWGDGAPARPSLEPAVVKPVGQARPDFAVLTELCRAAGARPFGSRAVDLSLRAGLDPIRAAQALLALPSRTPRLSLHGDGKVHLAPPELLRALAERAGSTPDPHALRLVTSVRPVETLNHWLHGSRGAQRRVAVARVHPAELTRRGLEPGMVRLRAEGAPAELQVVVEVVADPELRQGVVVLPFGWGHLEGAVDAGGVAANALIRSDVLEAFTGQPRSNGQPVLLEALAAVG